MVYLKKTRNILILVLSLLVLNTGMAGAFEDGFSPAKKIDGKNTIVYYESESDPPYLIQKLDMRPSDIILAGKALGGKASSEDELTNLLDVLFIQVSDVLDMHLYSLKINIKICKNETELKALYKRLFNSELGPRPSFYIYDTNSIYIAQEQFKREMLGHEMAHAIICHYFVVPPPVKIQEVLAMYVEYNLRRAGQQ